MADEQNDIESLFSILPAMRLRQLEAEGEIRMMLFDVLEKHIFGAITYRKAWDPSVLLSLAPFFVSRLYSFF